MKTNALGVFLCGLLFAVSSKPSDSGSNPVLYEPRVENSRFCFAFQALPETVYEVQHADSLGGNNWTTLQTAVGSNAPVTITDPALLLEKKFYRVVASRESTTIPADEVRAVARSIYDQIEQGTPFDPEDIALLFSIFGIAPISETNNIALQASVDAWRPFLLNVQAEAIAKKMNEGFYVTIDSFISAMSNDGAKTRAGEPLTRGYLDPGLTPFLGKDRYPYNEILPALVLALGAERASRFPAGATDPVWGDGLLDPIQYHLLLYSFLYASAIPSDLSSSPPAQVRDFSHKAGLRPMDAAEYIPTLIKWGPGMGKFLAGNAVIGGIGWLVDYPLGLFQSGQAAVCASCILFGYEVKVTADPIAIWRRAEPPEPGRPYQSTIRATVNYSFQPNQEIWWKELALWYSMCDFPTPGPQENRLVEWTLEGQLPGIGMLTPEISVTGIDGQARTDFQAKEGEHVPAALRAISKPKSAAGHVRVRVPNLLTRFSSLEPVVRALNPENVAVDRHQLRLIYYEWPELTLEFQSQITGEGLDSFVAAAVFLQKRKEIDPATGIINSIYEGSTLEDYRTFTAPGQGSGWSLLGLDPGTFRVGIPVQNVSAEDFSVMLDLGALQERVLLTPAEGSPVSQTWSWFGSNWKGAHQAEEATSRSYPGYYAIKGWELARPSILQKRYEQFFTPAVPVPTAEGIRKKVGILVVTSSLTAGGTGSWNWGEHPAWLYGEGSDDLTATISGDARFEVLQSGTGLLIGNLISGSIRQDISGVTTSTYTEQMSLYEDPAYWYWESLTWQDGFGIWPGRPDPRWPLVYVPTDPPVSFVGVEGTANVFECIIAEPQVGTGLRANPPFAGLPSGAFNEPILGGIYPGQWGDWGFFAAHMAWWKARRFQFHLPNAPGPWTFTFSTNTTARFAIISELRPVDFTMGEGSTVASVRLELVPDPITPVKEITTIKLIANESP